MINLSGKTVLIIGQLPDIHITTVEEKLKLFGANVLIFDRLRPDKCRIKIHFDSKKPQIKFYISNKFFNIDDINAVWWRVKPIIESEITGQINSIASIFIKREWQGVLYSLDFFLPKARWVNPRLADLKARNKPTQLLIANELGF